MSVSISRRKLAKYYIDSVIAGDETVLQKLAGYLVRHGREREVELIARDVASEMVSRGYVEADVASAQPLDGLSISHITRFLSVEYPGAEISLRCREDPTLIGGVVVTTPDAVFDATVLRRIKKLRGAKKA